MNKVKQIIAVLLSLLSMNVFAYHPGDKVVLATEPGCSACEEAKSLLRAAHIPFVAKPAWRGYAVPQLYVNGKYRGLGVGAVEAYIHE